MNSRSLLPRGRLALAGAAAVLLAACGGGDDDPPPAAAAQPLSCAELAGTSVPASAIGLPTSGATVTAATPVAASGSGAASVPAHCLVTASIAGVDAAAPRIVMRVALPET